MTFVWKFIRRDWAVFVLATIAAAVIWHLTDDAVDKIEGKQS